MVRILVAEDEERIARFIEKGLRAAGYAPTVVADGVTAVDYASSGQYDLLLLDIGLPRLDGFMVLSVLRRDHLNIPVIFLTARDSAADTVAGLEGGADDYMAKPFRFEELVARIRLRLRPSDGSEALAGNTMRSGSLELNLHTHTLSVGGGKIVELSAREFALVEMFLHHPGQILSRQQLLSHVWGYDFDSTSNIVDVYVRQLRQKIGAERDHYRPRGRLPAGNAMKAATAPTPRLWHGYRDGQPLNDPGTSSWRAKISSVRFRVVAAMLVMMAAGLSVAGVITFYVQFQESDARVDQGLLDKAHAVIKLVKASDKSDSESFTKELHEAAVDIEPRSNEVMAVITDGRVTWTLDGTSDETMLAEDMYPAAAALADSSGAAFGDLSFAGRRLRTVAPAGAGHLRT